MTLSPRNMLVIDFGQLGDVVMSLPALRAIREQFPHARITVAAGKPSSQIVELSGYADEVIAVDRVALRDGFKPLAILRILNVVKDIRRREFDFVIDLHSFSETNLMGFLSGASKRLFARRPGRSLDFLANFSPKPPVDRNDPDQHLVDRYLDVLKPLGITEAARIPKINTRAHDDRTVDSMLKKAKAESGAPLVGLFPGAGHPGRCWPTRKWAELADFLIRNDGVRPVVFVGPEERAVASEMRRLFPSSAVFLQKLSIGELAAAQARLAVFVSNDTGPVHIAAAVGTPIVVLIGRPTPHAYIPLADSKRLIFSHGVHTIEVEEVYSAARELLAAERMATLFAS
ncbi:MAG TPA: glycosyltransferase family 9 protein [Pyrinomonadaceae bacterium]